MARMGPSSTTTSMPIPNMAAACDALAQEWRISRMQLMNLATSRPWQEQIEVSRSRGKVTSHPAGPTGGRLDGCALCRQRPWQREAFMMRPSLP